MRPPPGEKKITPDRGTPKKQKKTDQEHFSVPSRFLGKSHDESPSAV
jgi:hypothetical protein